MATLGGGHRFLLEVRLLRSDCPTFGGLIGKGLRALSRTLSPAKGIPFAIQREGFGEILLPV